MLSYARLFHVHWLIFLDYVHTISNKLEFYLMYSLIPAHSDIMLLPCIIIFAVGCSLM